jgi:hypothetical protein
MGENPKKVRGLKIQFLDQDLLEEHRSERVANPKESLPDIINRASKNHGGIRAARVLINQQIRCLLDGCFDYRFCFFWRKM